MYRPICAKIDKRASRAFDCVSLREVIMSRASEPNEIHWGITHWYEPDSQLRFRFLFMSASHMYLQCSSPVVGVKLLKQHCSTVHCDRQNYKREKIKHQHKKAHFEQNVLIWLSVLLFWTVKVYTTVLTSIHRTSEKNNSLCRKKICKNIINNNKNK